MSALEHDERCERTTVSVHDPVFGGAQRIPVGPVTVCRCLERALTAARQREEEAKAEIARLKAENTAWFHTKENLLRVRDALLTENARLTLAASESARTLQVEIARLKQRGGICPHSALRDCAADNMIEERDALKAQVTALREALAPLLAVLRIRNERRDWPAEEPVAWLYPVTNGQIWALFDALATLPQAGA